MITTKILQNKRLMLALYAAFALGACLVINILTVKADNVIAGFSTKTVVQPGMVVALDKSAPDTVKPAPASDPNQIYGVAVDPSDAPITLVGDNSKAFVATTGTYQVLVSVENGPIKSGNYLSMSGIDGIAGKALASQGLILGKATGDFNGTSNVITTNNGKAIGRISVTIGVQKNPISVNDPTLPSFLRKVADGIGNRSVPVIRVYVALFIFLISLLAALTILWSGVRSSLISLGRNPLSKKAIFSGMYKTVITGVFVFIIGLAGVYLLIKI